MGQEFLEVRCNVDELPQPGNRPWRDRNVYERPTSLFGAARPFKFHDVERLEQGLAGYAEAFGQRLFGRQLFAAGENPFGDVAHQSAVDFLVTDLCRHLKVALLYLPSIIVNFLAKGNRKTVFLSENCKFRPNLYVQGVRFHATVPGLSEQ